MRTSSLVAQMHIQNSVHVDNTTSKGVVANKTWDNAGLNRNKLQPTIIASTAGFFGLESYLLITGANIHPDTRKNQSLLGTVLLTNLVNSKRSKW